MLRYSQRTSGSLKGNFGRALGEHTGNASSVFHRSALIVNRVACSTAGRRQFLQCRII
jgi:hypothetical protein